ncbi:winged helix DNA-binding domain-containing protein [Cellulomonas fimi]|uniref:Winged helix DNA-binding domain-containing protein n=1 Tax=Cellulomonas fimi (strain ATCC 484 / DSM 20113 / JCM 1341 / CCUG 24087 / LMG 16345 / NBRC 15513 / NCIMB 8980 / NCTC 7547 / NRS-133) TaxID=590998 RepID=F4H4U0_CELFA|nr:winged helix DNA-binding domain-containing protein [Cellulomonas fimi]AEE44291.1 hypothetical protein Celf_0142 [Cellulomonas fimi ATCC 484]NNH05738.1 winged helix DNA-binding domain-containing protein [Cellulomonas fimi]VEH26056.1 Uncharacterized protein conserved in bacteria [Cellulomonas fimi]
MPHLDTAERRARLARRHAVHPAHRVPDVESAARAVVALHATDPAGLYLSAWARTDTFAVDDLDRAFFADRTLVKQLAMRRTLFAVPRDLLPVVLAASSAKVAATERRRLEKEVVGAGLATDGAAWFDAAAAATVAELAGGVPLTSTQLRQRLAEVDGHIHHGGDKPWAGRSSVASRVLTCLQAAGVVVRAGNLGRWTASRPTWALARDWLGTDPEPLPERDARATLVRHWLARFGPGTTADVRWWLGSTLRDVRQALQDVAAVEVSLDGGLTGWVLPDDVDPVGPVEPWVALLPWLDPATMGWTDRDWYVGAHRAQVYDSVGNGAAAIWADGRIVGAWTVDGGGQVQLYPLEDLGRERAAAVDAEADRLTRWLAGTPVLPRFPAPLVGGR